MAASPFGHTLAGSVFGLNHSAVGSRKKLLLWYIVAANAADFDFIPGIILGAPNVYHHGISHSIGAAFIFSLMAATLLTKWLHLPRWTLFTGCLGAYSTHLVMDYFAQDARPPIGIPIFWPFQEKYYTPAHPFLPAFSHGSRDLSNITEFLSGIFSAENLQTIWIEFLFCLPIVFLYALFQSLHKKRLLNR